MEAQDPNFEERVRGSFARQAVMGLIGAEITRVEPGTVDLSMPFRADLTQQHGFVHAGIITTLVDSACGYAALSTMPPDTGVLSVEYKVNFVAPARGSHFLAKGRVLRAGRTIVVCTGDVLGVQDGEETLVATMLATMMVIRDRPGVSD
jgi:uncharacterized protein (TIGR00369 family)